MGPGGDNSGLKVQSCAILPASPVLSTSFTLPVPLPAHANANAHTPKRTKRSRTTVCGALHLPHTRSSREVNQIKVEIAHTGTHQHAGKHELIIYDAYLAKSNQELENKQKIRLRDFTPFQSSSPKEQKLTFLVSPWFFLFCGIFKLLRVVFKFPPEV